MNKWIIIKKGKHIFIWDFPAIEMGVYKLQLDTINEINQEKAF